jgi:hypothetical protein
MQFNEWKEYFLQNRAHFTDLDFNTEDQLTEEEKRIIFSSIQQFQNGENSEGKHLYSFAKRFPDPKYLECIRLFIPEEQMHAKVLGKFMKKHGIPLIKSHWVDRVFRSLRKLAGIENTVRVLLTAEIIAKVYYKGLRQATGSELLKKICTQILYDEEQHILFQCDALRALHQNKNLFHRFILKSWQRILMLGTIVVVWHYHKEVLRKGGYYFGRFFLENLLIYSEAERLIMKKDMQVIGKKVMMA